MMVIAIGLSCYNIALFHLVNHAFYKALLFLGAGAVIHSVGDIQDFRKFGGLKIFLPLAYSVMLIASLSLVAIHNYKQIDEGNMFINLPLIILAIFSIFFGYLTKDIFIGIATSFFSDNSIFIHPSHEIMLDTEFAVITIFKLLPFIFTISLTLISLIFYEFFGNLLINFKFSNLGYNIYSFFS